MNPDVIIVIIAKKYYIYIYLYIYIYIYIYIKPIYNLFLSQGKGKKGKRKLNE